MSIHASGESIAEDFAHQVVYGASSSLTRANGGGVVTALIAEAGPRGWDTLPVTRRNSIIVVGYARVAATAAAHAVREYFTITLRIDRNTHVVAAVDSTAATGLVRDWLAELLLGIDFSADLTGLLAEIEADYLGQGNGAIRQAIGDAWRRYAARTTR
jgi:Domain of unknown function (DUF3870)